MNMTNNNRQSGTATRAKQGVLVAAMAAALIGASLYVLVPAKIGIPGFREGLSIIAIFFAGIVASAAGFAFSAIAGALIVHLYPDPLEMVRILLVCSITIQVYCTLMLIRSIRWRELAPYLAGGLLTAPLGVFMLAHFSSHAYSLTLGALLVGYGLYSLKKPIAIDVQRKPILDAMVGALGGITGGLAAFPGAFVTVWCSARGLSKESQRAICQPYILFMQLATLIMVEHVRNMAGGSLYSLWMLVPVSLVSASVGFRLFRYLTANQFRVVVLNMLVASGLLLVLKSW